MAVCDGEELIYSGTDGTTPIYKRYNKFETVTVNPYDIVAGYVISSPTNADIYFCNKVF
jgi:hypothetical protein